MIHKSKTSVWLTIVLTAIVGILFVVWHGNADVLNRFVIAIGIMIIAPAAYLLVIASGSIRRSDGDTKPDIRRRLSTAALFIAALCTIALGLWMAIAPGTFRTFITFLFGTILAVYGLYLALIQALLARHTTPWWLYIVPAAMAATGFIILLTPLHEPDRGGIVVLITGIALIASAINWTVQRILTPKPETTDNDSDTALRQAAIPETTLPKDNVIDFHRTESPDE